MRIRSIKPEFWTSEQVTELAYRARLLFIGLLNQCDKNGCLACRPKLIRRNIFPFDDVLISDVEQDLQAIYEAGLIHLYRSTTEALQHNYRSTSEDFLTESVKTVAEAEFIFVPNFLKHQTLNTWESRKSKTTLPLPVHFIATSEALQKHYTLRSEKWEVISDKREVRSEKSAPPLQKSVSDRVQDYLNRFHAVHDECKKTSAMSFVSALRAQNALEADAAVIDEALGAFERQCSDLISFRPQTPIGKFENYLRRAMDDFSKNKAAVGESVKPQRLRV